MPQFLTVAPGRLAQAFLFALSCTGCDGKTRGFTEGPPAADAGAGQASDGGKASGGRSSGGSATGGSDTAGAPDNAGTGGVLGDGGEGPTSGGTGGGVTHETGGAPATGGTTTSTTGGKPATGGAGGLSCTASGNCTDIGKPICRESACAVCKTSEECADRDASQPSCDAASGKCVECTSSAQCTDPATPICSSAFVCVACGYVGLPTNACSKKNASAPICDPSGKCVGCTVDDQCAGATPICGTSQVCQACTSDDQCVKKSGANPGVCMAHQDGRCAADAEAIYVEKSSGCSASIDSTSGTAAKPYCRTSLGLGALSATRRLIVVRGTAAGFSYYTPGPQLTVVGQLRASLFPDNDPTSSCVDLSNGADVYMRDFSCNTNWNTPGIVAHSSTLRMQRAVIFNSAGGALLDGTNFDIVDAIFSNNEGGGDGTTRFGGILVNNPPATGPKNLQRVTFEDNNSPTDITCSSAITGVGVYAPDNKIGAACGITTCSPASASCGSSLTWVNPGG